jgi:ankyrin repeat protein
VRYLAGERKADFTVRDQLGNDAFYYACANGHVLVATYLLGLGPDINEGNTEGNTPLHVAARWGHKEMARLLLHFGANTRAESTQDAPGVRGPATPAQVARGVGHDGIAKLIEEFVLDDGPVGLRVEMIEPGRPGS